MLTILLVAVVVVVVAALLNGRAVKQFWRAGQVQVGKVGRAVAATDSLASYEERIDEHSDTIRKAREHLDRHRGAIRDLESKKTDLLKDQARLTNQIKTLLAQDPNSGKKTAVKLSVVEADLAEVTEEIKTQTASYEKFKNDIEQEQNKIKALRADAAKLKGKLKQSEISAEMAEFKPTPLDSSKIEEDRARVISEINKNLGKVDVAMELSDEDEEDVLAAAADNEAKAQEILARFKTNEVAK